jgi:protein-tyrosine phosphatase
MMPKLTSICARLFSPARQKSREYAKAIESGQVPYRIQSLPIRDYEGPDDDEAFCRMALDVANWLRQGKVVLVHCGAGIGRTGMFAIAVLMALGLSKEKARRLTKAAGSAPERASQEAALRRFATFLDTTKEGI